MPKPIAKTTLYRLIETGHLARQALLQPLGALHLESGDDALLLELMDKDALTLEALAAQTGLSLPALESRLDRLADLNLIIRMAAGPNLLPGVKLTSEGKSAAQSLAAHWRQLEHALMDELKSHDHKKLRHMLKRFSKLLVLQG